MCRKKISSAELLYLASLHMWSFQAVTRQVSFCRILVIVLGWFGVVLWWRKICHQTELLCPHCISPPQLHNCKPNQSKPRPGSLGQHSPCGSLSTSYSGGTFSYFEKSLGFPCLIFRIGGDLGGGRGHKRWRRGNPGNIGVNIWPSTWYDMIRAAEKNPSISGGIKALFIRGACRYMPM